MNSDLSLWRFFHSGWKAWFPGLGSRSAFVRQATNLYRITDGIRRILVDVMQLRKGIWDGFGGEQDFRENGEAETWPEVPPLIATPALEEAMSILSHFQQNEEMHHVYQARLDAQRRQRTQQVALERAERERQAAEQRAEEAEQLAMEASEKALEQIGLREEAEAQAKAAEAQAKAAEAQAKAAEAQAKAAEAQAQAKAAEAQAQAERDRAERLSARLRALGLSEL